MLRVRALVDMTDAAFGEERTVGDGPDIRALIENRRYELLEEIADEPAKPAKGAKAAESEAV